MKNIFKLLVAGMFFFTACSDDEGNPPKDGENQVPQPVETSGPDVEGERAVQATVNDSIKAAQRRDSAK